MKVRTYIDGFNLYHSLKNLGDDLEYLKWQDLKKLSNIFLSRNDYNFIKFFTAYPTWKQNALKKHQDYVKILEDMGIEVILGEFKKKTKKCSICGEKFITHEEKRTDVNIAIHIIQDIYKYKPEIIQLITGDTDLIPPLEMAKSLGVKIHVVIPINRNINHFKQIVHKQSNIKLKHLKQCFIGHEYTTKTLKYKCPYTLP